LFGFANSIPPTDTTPPAGTVQINGGAATTDQAAVTLSLTATDNASGVAQMRFSNDGTTFGMPVAFAATAPWTLASGNGTKTVHAQFRDGAGNWSNAFTDTIVLDVPVPVDTTPPSGTIAINGGAASTTQTAVTLTLTATDNDPLLYTVVTPPAPIPVAPITEKEVAPAPPPETQAPAKPAAPARRTRYDIAIIQALDKVTAESLRFEAQVNRPVRYKSLVFTVRACERSAVDEPIDDSIAYLTIDSQPRATPGGPPLAAKQAFKGWMYASSPGLHPLEHPVYDAWLISCRAAVPVSPPPASPPAPAR